MSDKKLQILLVENEYYLGRTLAEAMRFNLGERVAVHLSNTFEDAVAYSNTERVDLVISEWHFSRGSGIDLIEAIKQTHPEVRSILMTDYSLIGSTKNKHNQKADGYLTKPFELAKLFSLIRTLTRLDSSVRREDPPTNEKKSKQESMDNDMNIQNYSQPHNLNGHTNGKTNGRILVMDDDTSLRRIYRKALQRHNFEIFEAETLQQARDLLNVHTFDLFICDVHLGRERGTDILEERGDDLRAAGTTTIMVSAYGQYRMLLKDLGADFFLDKPISIGSLIHLVDRVIGSKPGYINA